MKNEIWAESANRILAESGIIGKAANDLKIKGLGHHNPRLHVDDVLLALSISAVTNPLADLALAQLPKLRGAESHSSVILSSRDMGTLNRLGIRHTCEPFYETKKLYHSK